MSDRRHVILIGLPAAGKTTIGQRAAAALGAPFVDIDAVIVRQQQMPIASVIGELGEARFRELERQAVRAVLTGGTPTLIAPGAGWAVQPGQIEVARTSALLIYLKTMATSASKRIGSDASRPLLAGDNLLERLRDVLAAREPFYARSDHEVTTDGRSVEAITDDVVALARLGAGW